MSQIPQAAIALAKRFEGFHRVPKSDPLRRAHPYICPAGYWTIGYGRLCKPDHPPIDEEEGEVYLRQDLRTVLAAALRYCPHFLGAGIGLRMSAHLLAAAGGDGLLEIDANPNPLRELTCDGLSPVHDGTLALGGEPGIGPPPDLGALARFAVSGPAGP